MRMIRRMAIVCSLVLVNGGIAAGVPLPSPPFTTGGFVPPDSTILKQEIAVGKLLTKYAVGRGKCDARAVTDLQLAYEPAGMAKVPAVQVAWTQCQANVALKYEAGRDKLILKGTPACLDQPGIDAIRAEIDARFPLLGPTIYCDGDAASPDSVTMLNIPDFRNEAKGEVAAAKVLTKVGGAAGKCYTLALKYAFKLGGTLLPEIAARVEECFTRVRDVGDDAMDTLDQTQALPSCLPLNIAQGGVGAIVGTFASNGIAGQFTGELYCAE